MYVYIYIYITYIHTYSILKSYIQEHKAMHISIIYSGLENAHGTSISPTAMIGVSVGCVEMLIG